MTSPIQSVRPLDFVWSTADPFLFCVHHLDQYPAGTDSLGPPRASLRGRRIGMDFEGIDGWRMYHGDVVPGFPQHPHRGFETVTVVRQGHIDHADSMGAQGRFGAGDTQWMTAGRGVVHSEMFPMLNRDGDNPCELFQIWLNLPRADKMVEPHYTMLWHEDVPTVRTTDGAGRATEVLVVAGRYGDAAPPSPPPRSWASRPDSDVAIWTITMEPGATWTLPAGPSTANRTLYHFGGGELTVADRTTRPKLGITLVPDAAVPLTAGEAGADLVLLQGRPIGEPTVQHGPFVMNSAAEIQQAFFDYQRTRFGGWPHGSDGPVYGPEPRRFAKHADGTLEER